MGQGREVRGETWSQGVYEPILRPTLLSGRRLALASGGGRVLPSFSFKGAGWVCGQLGPLTGHGLHCGQTHICEEGPALGRLTGSSSLLCTPGPPSCRDAQGSPLPAGTVSGSPSTLALNRAVLGVPTNQVSAASFALPPVTRISDLLASSPPLLGGSQPQQGRGGGFLPGMLPSGPHRVVPRQMGGGLSCQSQGSLAPGTPPFQPPGDPLCRSANSKLTPGPPRDGNGGGHPLAWKPQATLKGSGPLSPSSRKCEAVQTPLPFLSLQGP